jgi:hypothetical protein
MPGGAVTTDATNCQIVSGNVTYSTNFPSILSYNGFGDITVTSAAVI